MYRLRVTAPDGTTTTHAFAGPRCTVGRLQGNDVVLDGRAVSALHCAFELTEAGCVLRERGSSNGTWVDGRRIAEPMPVTEGDRIYVGDFLLELTRTTVAPRTASPFDRPILRTAAARDRAWRELLGRFGRYAVEWDRKGRPRTLALRRDELARARRWLREATGDRAREITQLHRELIDASDALDSTRRIKRGLTSALGFASIGALLVAAIVFWPEPTRDPIVLSEVVVEHDEGDESSGSCFEEVVEDLVDEDELEEDMNEIGDVDEPIHHEVIPFETLGDIATRYGVTVDDIASWNYLNPDDPDLQQGHELVIEEPERRPLPQTRVDYQIDDGEASWTTLADRFDVPATRLEAYNTGIVLARGKTISVWIDPKPYLPRDPDAKIPDYSFGTEAQSIGKTNGGRLANARQLPASPLYMRRAPTIMYGSAYTVEKVMEAVAAFRRDVAYDGELILADMSQPGGGYFSPHKSHQSGRDIDIWLPTLRGVYKIKYLSGGRTRERRPLREEVDWYALWGLVRALIRTGAVEDVFLDWRYQEYVYRAAVNMGATAEELDAWIQWPRPRTHSKGIFRHSKDHLSHIHVRFKCAPWERACNGERAKTVED